MVFPLNLVWPEKATIGYFLLVVLEVKTEQTHFSAEQRASTHRNGDKTTGTFWYQIKQFSALPKKKFSKENEKKF